MHNQWLLWVCLFLLLIPLSSGCTSQPYSAPPSTDASKTTQQPVSTAPNALQAQPTQTKLDYVPWNAAKDHVGENVKVCGTVGNVTYAVASKGKPTFINIGNAYPNPNRFVALIWGENRAKCENIINSMFYGRNVCVIGTITLYDSVPEIEVTSPSQIEIR